MARPAARSRILVVGSGEWFISGISHYTRYIAEALAARCDVSVILMRRLIPRRLYPGRDRVGAELTGVGYPAGLPVFDGLDWYWLPSMFRALRFLRRQAPEVMLIQWWTGAVLHSYLALVLVARLRGTKVIVEIHELQDSGEAQLRLARWYVEKAGIWLMAQADAYIVHSASDRAALRAGWHVQHRPIEIVRHGPYSHYDVPAAEPMREAPASACNVLFFGTIRPYKGLEDLVAAFEQAQDERGGYWLTIVGETWEGCIQPLEMVARSRHRDRITLVNRYVSDSEASRWFAGADLVALPYRRSSASGPLHMTMSAGLPVVVSELESLLEATAGYEGAVHVRPGDPSALAAGIHKAAQLRGRDFEDPASWEASAETILALARQITS